MSVQCDIWTSPRLDEDGASSMGGETDLGTVEVELVETGTDRTESQAKRLSVC